MNKGRKLIIHIGSHKTGTTSIQKFMLDNKNLLEDNGWSLFSKNRAVNNRVHYSEGSINSWIDFSGKHESFCGRLSEKILSELSKTQGNIIISSEELSWCMTRESIENIKKIMSNIFSDISIIVYFRRQDEQLLSHYQQGFRFKESTAAKFYGRELTPLPEHKPYFDNYLNYARKLELWRSVFGEENVYWNLFDKNCLYKNNIINDFLTNIGIDVPVKNEFTNQALSKENIIFNYHVFSSGVLDFCIRPHFMKKLSKNGGKKFLPSESEMKEVMSSYEECNKILFEEKGLKFSDVKEGKYPKEKDTVKTSDYEIILKDFFDFLSNLSLRDIVSICYRYFKYKVK